MSTPSEAESTAIAKKSEEYREFRSKLSSISSNAADLDSLVFSQVLRLQQLSTENERLRAVEKNYLQQLDEKDREIATANEAYGKKIDQLKRVAFQRIQQAQSELKGLVSRNTQLDRELTEARGKLERSEQRVVEISNEKLQVERMLNSEIDALRKDLENSNASGVELKNQMNDHVKKIRAEALSYRIRQESEQADLQRKISSMELVLQQSSGEIERLQFMNKKLEQTLAQERLQKASEPSAAPEKKLSRALDELSELQEKIDREKKISRDQAKNLRGIVTGKNSEPVLESDFSPSVQDMNSWAVDLD